jgi:hypothetical protein
VCGAHRVGVPGGGNRKRAALRVASHRNGSDAERADVPTRTSRCQDRRQRRRVPRGGGCREGHTDPPTWRPRRADAVGSCADSHRRAAHEPMTC